jgi:hypothetical protein
MPLLLVLLEFDRTAKGSPWRTGELSSEQSRASKCKTGENKGGVRMVTLRGVSGTHERRPGHGEDTGRQRWSCGSKSVSVNQANQRGRGEPKGVPSCG